MDRYYTATEEAAHPRARVDACRYGWWLTRLDEQQGPLVEAISALPIEVSRRSTDNNRARCSAAAPRNKGHQTH